MKIQAADCPSNWGMSRREIWALHELNRWCLHHTKPTGESGLCYGLGLGYLLLSTMTARQLQFWKKSVTLLWKQLVFVLTDKYSTHFNPSCLLSFRSLLQQLPIQKSQSLRSTSPERRRCKKPTRPMQCLCNSATVVDQSNETSNTAQCQISLSNHDVLPLSANNRRCTCTHV